MLLRALFRFVCQQYCLLLYNSEIEIEIEENVMNVCTLFHKKWDSCCFGLMGGHDLFF
jgi:hypothetical protein